VAIPGLSISARLTCSTIFTVWRSAAFRRNQIQLRFSHSSKNFSLNGHIRLCTTMTVPAIVAGRCSFSKTEDVEKVTRELSDPSEMELDHIFVWASPGGEEEARALAQFGLSEGTPNTHPGQGTACRRFFFRNAYLELLWVTDSAEAQSATIRPTHLWESWNARGTACPFGLCFRPGAEEGGSIPFPTSEYRPPYLPESLSFHAGTNAGLLNEPLLFYLPFSRRPDSQSAPRKQVMEHAAGLRELTRVELISPHADSLSPAFEAVLSTGVVRRRDGAGHFVELGFDSESKGRAVDLRPELPIVFSW
jgi:Glyoxalase-like domain